YHTHALVPNHEPPTPLSLFLHPPATTQPYTLSLHDALPIWARPGRRFTRNRTVTQEAYDAASAITASSSRPPQPPREAAHTPTRSEEHTSELQSRENLVCRLLLEKKKK